MEAFDVYNIGDTFPARWSPASDTIDGYFDLDYVFQAFPISTIPPDSPPFYDFDLDLFLNSETSSLSYPESPFSNLITHHQVPDFTYDIPCPVSNKRKAKPEPVRFESDTAPFSPDQHHPISKKQKNVPSPEPLDELDTFSFSESESESSTSRDSRKEEKQLIPVESLLEVSRSPEEADSDGLKEQRGMLIIHLLIALAEAISNESRDLAEVILIRLRKLVNSTGSNIERIGFYFYHAFQWLFTGKNELDLKPHLKVSPNNYLLAYRVLIEIYPCSRLAQFTANQCILESIPKDSRKIHILDFDLVDGLQWPPLMEALVSEGYAVKHIRLTSIKWADSSDNFTKGTINRLRDFAENLGFTLSSEEVELEDIVNCLREEEEEEVAVANCMYKLYHMFDRSSWQVTEFLEAAKIFYPRVFTLGCCNFSDEQNGGLVSRLASCLQIASAVCDSLESALPTQELARQMVERLVLGPRFCRELMFENKENNVTRLPENLGLVQGRMSSQNLEQARDLLRLQARDGHFYRLCSPNPNEISLKWGDTCLLSTSSWHVW